MKIFIKKEQSIDLMCNLCCVDLFEPSWRGIYCSCCPLEFPVSFQKNKEKWVVVVLEREREKKQEAKQCNMMVEKKMWCVGP